MREVRGSIFFDGETVLPHAVLLCFSIGDLVRLSFLLCRPNNTEKRKAKLFHHRKKLNLAPHALQTITLPTELPYHVEERTESRSQAITQTLVRHCTSSSYTELVPRR